MENFRTCSITAIDQAQVNKLGLGDIEFKFAIRDILAIDITDLNDFLWSVQLDNVPMNFSFIVNSKHIAPKKISLYTLTNLYSFIDNVLTKWKNVHSITVLLTKAPYTLGKQNNSTNEIESNFTTTDRGL